ncbi:MAG: ribosome maturation factor RimM [Rhizobiales bacterium]|nr:ribosome maturation factor RimM [Hyphomicrobiales bacterium]
MPPPERQLVVGVIGAPHGVRGEARIKSFTADPLSLGDYGALFLSDGRVLELAGGRALKDDMLVVRFKGIADRDAIKALTGQNLIIDRANLPETEDEDEFYHADLIGLRVEDQAGDVVGAVVEVHNHGAGDLLVIAPKKGGGTLLLPFTKLAAPVLDFAGGRIVIDPAYLARPERSQAPEGEA